MKRILCATTPCIDKSGKLAFQDAAWDSIKSLDMKNLVIDWVLLVENPFPVSDYMPVPDISANIAFKLEHARHMALRFGYDYLFLHETDVILPPDTLQKLIAANGDLATGVTRLRPSHGVGTDICLLTEWKEKPWVSRSGRMKFPYAFNAAKLKDYKIKTFQKKTFLVEGSGFACLLVSRRVLKAVPFKWYPADITFDIEYATAIHEKGFKWLCVGSVQCSHEDSDHTILRIGPQFWDATLVATGNVWQKFSKIIPVAPLKQARLHLGPHPKYGWINYDVEPLPDIPYALTPINKLSPHLPFEDDFFTEILIEGFAEKVLDKAKLISELSRVSREGAKITLNTTFDRRDPSMLSRWHPDMNFGDKMKVVSRSSHPSGLTWTLRSLKRR